MDQIIYHIINHYQSYKRSYTISLNAIHHVVSHHPSFIILIGEFSPSETQLRHLSSGNAIGLVPMRAVALKGWSKEAPREGDLVVRWGDGLCHIGLVGSWWSHSEQLGLPSCDKASWRAIPNITWLYTFQGPKCTSKWKLVVEDCG